MPSAMLLHITVLSGSAMGRELRISAPGLVGREPRYQPVLLLTDSSVSRRHALFSNQEGRWQVQDLGSANGTLLNGELLPANQPTALGARGRLLVGGEEGVLLEYKTIEASGELRLDPGRSGSPPLDEPATEELFLGNGGLPSLFDTASTPRSTLTPEEDEEPKTLPPPHRRKPPRATERLSDTRDPLPEPPAYQAPPALVQRMAELEQREASLRAELEQERARRQDVEARAQKLKAHYDEARKRLQAREQLAARMKVELEEARERLGSAPRGPAAGPSSGQRLLAQRALAVCQEFARTLEQLDSAVVRDDPTGVAQRALARAVARLGDMRTLLERLGQDAS